MKISTDDQRAIGLIVICVGFLCFLIGLGGQFKENYHCKAEIASTGFTAAAILVGIGVLSILAASKKGQS